MGMEGLGVGGLKEKLTEKRGQESLSQLVERHEREEEFLRELLQVPPESRILSAFRGQSPATSAEIASFANMVINRIAAEIVAVSKK